LVSTVCDVTSGGIPASFGKTGATGSTASSSGEMNVRRPRVSPASCRQTSAPAGRWRNRPARPVGCEQLHRSRASYSFVKLLTLSDMFSALGRRLRSCAMPRLSAVVGSAFHPGPPLRVGGFGGG
jgi:hypothetical protein